MLHIILLILKIIGIILAVVIGLFIIVSGIVLFTPVRYQGHVSYENTLESLTGVAKVTWLLHLVSLRISYQDKQLVWHVRAAWKKYPVPDEKLKPKQSVVPEKSRRSNRPAAAAAKKAKATVHHPDEKKMPEKLPPDKKTADKLSSDKKALNKKTAANQAAAKKAPDKRRQRNKNNKLRGWFEKIRKLIQNIKYTIAKIYDNIKMLLQKKDDLVTFIFLDVHKAAWAKCWREILRFLKYLKPDRFEVRGTFGFADPCLTGQVLAGLGMLYPFIGNNTFITPDFEQSILEGSILVKGKLRGVYILIIGIRLLLDKNVRKTMKDIKNYKF